jgi:hypothetical protein
MLFLLDKIAAHQAKVLFEMTLLYESLKKAKSSKLEVVSKLEINSYLKLKFLANFFTYFTSSVNKNILSIFFFFF